jgi:hypothetical protein
MLQCHPLPNKPSSIPPRHRHRLSLLKLIKMWPWVSRHSRGFCLWTVNANKLLTRTYPVVLQEPSCLWESPKTQHERLSIPGSGSSSKCTRPLQMARRMRNSLGYLGKERLRIWKSSRPMQGDVQARKCGSEFSHTILYKSSNIHIYTEVSQERSSSHKSEHRNILLSHPYVASHCHLAEAPNH